jgi:Domain of unknown function (DUF4263)
MTKDIEKILTEIFDPTIFPDEIPRSEHYKPPTFKDVQEIAQIIIDDGTEESFQKYFNKNPHFLFRAIPSSGDTICGLLIKPPIGNFFYADYAIVTVGQGGCGITLIELERPSDKLFTKKLTPAQKFQTALGQINDWNEWLVSNKQTFANTILTLLKKAPQYPKTDKNGSFKCLPNIRIENCWKGFGGYEDCYIGNLLVISRWSNLDEKEKKRLLFHNSKNRQHFFQIRTYDQLIRKGYDGPNRYW